MFKTTCWRLLLSCPHYLNGARPSGAMKMAKSCKEGTAAKRRKFGSEGHRFETQCQQGLLAVESLCFVYTISIDVGDVLVDCTFAIHVRDVT